jgi:S-adenosylmethionine hydrolase
VVNGQRVDQIVATYADIPPNGICGLFGSTDHLELAANSASAAEQLGVARGAVVEVRRG